MNYLAIDLGDKRCGLAYSHLGYIFTLPYIPRVEIISKLKKILIEKEILKIIVGMPYDLYGKDKRQLEKTQKFIQKLKIEFPTYEVIGVDERFTTFLSIDTLKQLGDKKFSEKKDSLSAYFILETYLDKIKNS